MRYFLFLAIMLLMLDSCSNQINTPEELDVYIASQESGLTKTKTANNFKLVSKLLPVEYLAWKDAEGNTSSYDSLHALHENSLTFLFRIGLEDKPELAGKDVVYYNVKDETSYKERQYYLNFGMASAFELVVDGESFKPALYNLENTYSLSNYRNIHLVFAVSREKLANAKEIDLIFTDRLFETGISHFRYNVQDLKLPRLNFIDHEN